MPVLLALLVALSGCGSSSSDAEADGPSKKALACRADWKDLATEIAGRDQRTNPSAMAQRWNTIAATVGYYRTSATGSDCGKSIKAQKSAMATLAAFTTKLAPFDMELRLAEVKSDAETYAAAPRPPAPSTSPAKKGKKQKAAPRAPRPADIATALKTLTTQAPLASQQQVAGWQQAQVTELGDAAAVARAVKDLEFLSSESEAYRACSSALARIHAAQKATG